MSYQEPPFRPVPATGAPYAEEHEHTLIESQIDGLLQGEGASEDHHDVLSFLATSGLCPELVNRVHLAIVNAEVKDDPTRVRPSKDAQYMEATVKSVNYTQFMNLLLDAKTTHGVQYARGLMGMVRIDKARDIAEADIVPMIGMLTILQRNGWPHVANATVPWNRMPEAATASVDTEPTSSVELLERARDIQEQRARDYDQPGGERSMAATVQAFNIITRRNDEGRDPVSESEGWLLMQILKDVRDRSTPNPHRDSLEDCVSYSALKAEARLQEAVPEDALNSAAPASTTVMLAQEVDYAIQHGWPRESIERLTSMRAADEARRAAAASHPTPKE